MKRVINKLSFFAAILLTNNVKAQEIMPAAYNSGIKINYIRSWDALAPLNQSDTLLSRSYKDVRQTTAYFDGLGRPLQTVIKKGSLVTGDTARDMISSVVYDAFGREVLKYLPFAANNTGSNTSISDGLFKLNPFQQDSTFNKTMFSDETYFYAKQVFESSPVNRVLENYAPGDSWVGTAEQSSEGNRRGIKMKYWVNRTADSVRVWRVTNTTNNFGNYTTDSIYRTGLLFKTVTQDEHNKQVIEFKDKEGKVILKKVQLTAESDTGTGRNYIGWISTYYIYDDMNNLRCVVQPKGVELLVANSWNMSYGSNIILDEQCFRYEYDGKKRVIMKKMPGAGIVYMVYDARDRLVMSQDSVMRENYKWLYIKYDVLNRDTLTGLITDYTYYNNAEYHRSHADTSFMWPNPSSYTDEVLTKKFYDNYLWRGWEGNPLAATRNSSYDNYLSTASNTVWPYPQDATDQSNQILGMLTGTKTKILGTSDYLYSVPFYDAKGRVIQSQNTNITGGTDINTVQYSWSGQPLITVSKQEKSGTNAQTSIVLSKVTYDDLWRPIKTEKKISTTKVTGGSMPGSWSTLNEIEYNALGQLKKKKLGGVPVDSLQYDYNIRGWALGMNRQYAKDTTSTSNWFGFDLGYDKTTFTVNGSSKNYSAAQYNGNIAGTLWRSTGDDMLRKYDFTYDAVNRLTSADFNQLNSNSFSKAAGMDFSTDSLTYDVNGNILSMNQKGWKFGGSVTIDSLIYGYNSNSNKLNYVTDHVNDSTTYLGDFKEYTNNTSQDYSYDGNGNLVSDANKKITAITYNYLNLPAEITFDYSLNPPYSSRSISYTYDAAGNKLKKETYESTGSGANKLITTTYINGVVYESKLTNQGGSPEDGDYTDSLQFISTEEGRARIKVDSSTIVYDYMIKDHLGNIRMVLTEEKDTVFYPPATMETATATSEETIYGNLPATRSDLPNNYPSISGNAKVAKVDGKGGPMIGPSIILKVMAGDKFNIMVDTWYIDGGSPDDPSSSPLNDLMYALAGGMASAGSKATQMEIYNSGILSPGVSQFLNSQSPASGRPKAYLNWILFDEHFNFVSSSSGFQQVPAESVYNNGGFGGNNTYPIVQSDLSVDKNGFLYIYVSNETPNIAVYFDNLQVTHIKGPQLEETHYYPFGLTMSGISSKAAGSLENKRKWNAGVELNTDFDLNLYETHFRSLDPQIGRFWQIDPKPTEYESPYVSMGDNPISNVDPRGDYFFGLFGSTSDQRRSARAFAEQTGGDVKNITSKNVSVKFTFKNGEGSLNIGVAETKFSRNGAPNILGKEVSRQYDALKNGWGRINPFNHEFELIPASGKVEMVDDPITMLGPGLLRGLLLKLGATAAVAAEETLAKNSTNALSEIRLTGEGESFIRYESENLAYSRITSEGGVTAGTYAAPASDGLIPLEKRAATYNLPDAGIPRPNVKILEPPAGTPIIGPRPVSGGTGNEVIFPFGF